MASTKYVLLVRHATTDLAGLLCGHLDPALNAAGRAQAANLADALRCVSAERIYSSDLLRAMQTAGAVASACNLAVLPRPGLREMSFGAWEGQRWRELQERHGFAGPIECSELCPPGGERFEHFRLRVAAALQEIAWDSTRDPVIVVTHLGVIRTAFAILAGVHPNSNALGCIDYCSAYRFVIAGNAWRFEARL